MITIESDILLPCSAEQAFDYVFNPDYFPKWMANFQSRSPVSDIQGQVGSTAEHIQRTQGKTIRFTERIEDIEAPLHFRVALSSKGLDVSAAYHIEAIDAGKCRLSLKEELKLKSFFFKSVRPFIYPMMKIRQEKDLKNLKNLVIAETLG